MPSSSSGTSDNTLRKTTLNWDLQIYTHNILCPISTWSSQSSHHRHNFNSSYSPFFQGKEGKALDLYALRVRLLVEQRKKSSFKSVQDTFSLQELRLARRKCEPTLNFQFDHENTSWQVLICNPLPQVSGFITRSKGVQFSDEKAYH